MVGDRTGRWSLGFGVIDRALWAVGLLSLTPAFIAVAWGGIYADAAYQQFERAHLVTTGGGWALLGDSPLYTLLLALADLLHLPLPSLALALSVVGWTAAIVAWFFVGLALGCPAFSVAAVILLALHPQQGQALGLESGLVLGLWGLIVWLIVQRRARAALITTLLLGATQPLTLSFVLPLLVVDRASNRTRPGQRTLESAATLSYIVISTAVGAACYALAIILHSGWRDLHLSVPLWAALDLLAAAGFAAAGFAALVPRLDRRVLHQAIAVLSLAALVLWQGNTLIQDWHLRPTDRLALYEAIGQWLGENALPTETVAAQQSGLTGYLAQRATVPLPETIYPADLVAAIDAARPDYCVARNDLAWAGVRSSPWFQERYKEIYQLASPYDTATPLTVFRYTPSPFDEGDVTSATARFGGQVEMTGYRLDSQRITPGEPLHLTLYWQAAATILQPLRLSVRLADPATGRVWIHVENPAPGQVVTDLWRAGTRLEDHYTLLPPVDIPAGDHTLDVSFYHPNGQALPVSLGSDATNPTLSVTEGTRLVLASLNRPPTVSAAPLTPDHPLSVTLSSEIELQGYDVRSRIRPGETLRVVLYWHVLRPVPVDYKVFVHLLGPEDIPIAQDDGIPVNWTYPTTHWQPGETIRDEHLLATGPATPRGDYRLVAGLYDPDTGERPAVHDAAGKEIVNGLVPLRLIQVR